MVATGVISLVSATTLPLHDRIRAIHDIFPLAVPQVATELVAVSGIAFLLLSRGVRRGQRLAWTISFVLLTAVTVLHLLKGADIEEGVVTAAAAFYLFHNRAAFQTAGDVPSRIRGLLSAVAGAAVAVGAGTIAVEVRYRHTRHVPIWHALKVCAERLVGLQSDRLGGPAHGFDHFISPGLTAVGISLGIYTMWLLFRPVVLSHHPAEGDFTRARDIVRRHGYDTLAYFALRDDKRWFFYGESVVAYAIFNGVCLVSPDPVGPPEEREAVWSAFHLFADEHAWPVAVMAAGEEWLPIYEQAGMRNLYVGDEAIVDCAKFSLEGGEFKGLRQAVNRVARNGYRMEYYDPARVGPDLRA
jgi:lysyl-tRNA synthetase class 2